MNEDKATRYQRLKRRSGILSLIWTLIALGGLIVSGGAIAMRRLAADAAAGLASPGPWHDTLVVILFVVLLSLFTEIGSLPLAFQGGFLLERRYGLSREPLGRWAVDQAKSFALSLVLGATAASAVFAMIRISPHRWWLYAGLLFAVAIVGMVHLAPVLLMPLFYRIEPLSREALRVRLVAMADRAGARVLGAYEWGLGDKTSKANAALTGVGSTRRILVSDTMLADYTDDEIEVVLAHELAHHVHGDIWKGIAFESVLVIAGFFMAAKALGALAGPVGLTGVSDVAGLPLLLLAAGAVSMVMLPVAHAMSRAHERAADRFAVRLTRNPGAFVSAMRKLGAQNLAEEQPSKLVEWLFYSHPPVRDRIAAVQDDGRG